MAEIRLSGINKVYPGGTHAVHDVDLHIADGEFMIMVGPSGCAKSTILRMIAGLETPTAGTIEIGGRVVNDIAPKDRDIAMVFQSYALYPHMTVRENMAFGLKLRRMPASEIDQRVADAARILGLEQLLDRLPKAMSGGQRQRVAMGRAIVREPQAFLMDEPLSNLDAKLRVQMRTEIAKLHQRLSTTTVYVTHDQVEAMTLGQRICILRAGVVQQVDTPFQVYQNPANVFVGGFIGSPGMNFMDGVLEYGTGGLLLRLGEHRMALPASVEQRMTTEAVHGRSVIVGIRPEHLSPSTDQDPSALAVQIELIEAMGAEAYAYFTTAVSSPDLTALADTQASMSTFVARLAAGTESRSGGPMHLRPDLHEVHLFDPASFTTLLAPASEAEVRARQTGSAIELAGGTSRPILQTHAATSGPTMEHHIMLNDEPAAIGTLGEYDPARMESVFEQPVAPPIAMQPFVLGARNDTAGTYPRPTFEGQHTDDPALTKPRSHVPVAPSPVPVPVETPTPVDQPAPAHRGFAPRVIGARQGAAEPVATAALPETQSTIALSDAHVDVALDRIERAEPLPQTPALTFAPLTQAPTHEAARPTSAFRAALARLRDGN